jgi:hypothetical protein
VLSGRAGARYPLAMEDQVAWRACPYRAPVLDAHGGHIGTSESLLGDEEEDIFHGIVVKHARDGKLLEVPASEVTRITASHIETALTTDAVARLQPYREQKWFHLGWGGLFRKHPQWREGE